MVTGFDEDTDERLPASSPCMLHELNADGQPRPASDVARWRKMERKRLLEARSALTEAYRTMQTRAAICALDDIVEATSVGSIGLYWPIRGEPDLHSWMASLSNRGLRVALPVATALGQALIFREWTPGARLAHGIWNIPFPSDGAEIVPEAIIAPLVGFDARCYRLGYGGGFIDRTLASISPTPLAVGVGFPCAEIPTIHPQAHDIPMDWVVTGASQFSTR